MQRVLEAVASGVVLMAIGWVASRWKKRSEERRERQERERESYHQGPLIL